MSITKEEDEAWVLHMIKCLREEDLYDTLRAHFCGIKVPIYKAQ